MHLLSCVLWDNWYPLLTLLFYLFVPCVVCLFLRSRADSGFSDAGHKGMQHWAEFFTAALASFLIGVPVILCHAGVITRGAMLTDLAGIVLTFTTGGLASFFCFGPEMGDSTSLFGG